MSIPGNQYGSDGALGLLEIKSFSAALVALDAAQKAGSVGLIQAELNDLCGVVLKLEGSVADVRAAVDAGQAVAQGMQVECLGHVIAAPTPLARTSVIASREYNALIEQDVVYFSRLGAAGQKEQFVSEQSQLAIGMIETQGFTAVIEAIDTAVKAAAVEVIGKEKLGGGYIAILIRGDVAAVQAAVDAGRKKVEGLGKLIAAHVIARPSPAIVSLLPKAQV
ncbi:MAG: BMC domain-containing protein [Phycisphaerales bacterium]|nr:BMC domain-containing protein [Phycisphaerales bacterium]